MAELRHIITFIIAMCAMPLCMATGSLSVKNIRTSSQLPERSIKQIYRDSDGYMWYGTSNGLCRDDGYDITIFHPGNENNINYITEDSIGHIWVATDKGALSLDKRNFKVEALDEARIGHNSVKAIYQTRDGHLWISQHGKLRRYDDRHKWVKDYIILDRKGMPTFVSGFCQTRDEDILLTSYTRGVMKYDRDSDSFVMYRTIDKDVPLGMIIEDRKNDYFWVCDFNGTLYRFTPDSPERFVPSLIRSPKSPPSHYENLLDMVQDDRTGYIWGVSRNHLLIFRPESDGTLTTLDSPVCDRFAGAMMICLYYADGDIWIGCLDRESATVHLDDNYMTFHALPLLRRRYDNQPVIKAIAKAGKEGLYWMLQHRSGLLLYDTYGNDIVYNDDNPAFVRMRLRMAEEMAESPSLDGVWVSQERSKGIYALTHRDMSIEVADSIMLDSYLGANAKITFIHEDSRKRVWVGSSEGLYTYDLNRHAFTGAHPDLGYISGVVETPGRRVYGISKEHGLFEVTGSGSRLISSATISLLKASAIGASPDGHLWVGTDNGTIVEYNPSDESFTEHESLGQELNNSGIRQIYIGDDGHGWAMSESKLLEFSTRTGLRFLHDVGTDIPLYRMLSPNSCATPDGPVFGGIGGMVQMSSNPMLDTDRNNAVVVVTDIMVSGRSILPEAGDKLHDSAHLTLEPDAGDIEFRFSTLRHRHASKLRYAYRIKEIDDDWRYTAIGDNKAFYNHLGCGNYTLEVMACDEYGRMSESVTTLSIYRRPHFYESWWAISVYILVVIGGLCYGLYYYRRMINAKNEEMWSDSEEMMKMRTYLSSEITPPTEEYKKLDKILLDKATKAVENNLDAPEFDVNVLAAAVNMSRSTFSRKIKSITGMTPLDFIHDIKMRHACRLLESKNYTVGQVAEMVGYSDRRYFTASFGKVMGVSPREYQNKIKSSPEAEKQTPKAVG